MRSFSVSKKHILLMAAISIAAFVLLELVLRLAFFQCTMPEPNLCNYGVVKYFFNRTEGGGDLAPDQNGVWAIWPHRPYHVQTNSDGLRNTDEFDNEHDFVVLAVGDSFTFGPYVPNEDTWPAQLERLLDTVLYPRATTQVLNGGVSGYTIVDEYHYLHERGVKLEPDLVIIAFFPNDISDMRTLEREYLARPVKQVYRTSYARWARSILTEFEHKSAILRSAHNIKSYIVRQQLQADQAMNSLDNGLNANCDPFQTDESTYEESCWKSYSDWFSKTVLLLKQHDIPLLLVSIPDYRQFPEIGYQDHAQRFVSKLAANSGIPYIDMLPYLKLELDIDAAYLMEHAPIRASKVQISSLDNYTGNGHMSSYGYRIVANVIAQHLMDSNKLFEN